MLGLDVLPPDGRGGELLDVTVPRGRHLEARPGVRPHSALLPDDDLVQVDGLLVVSSARAFVDVARDFGVIEGTAAGDAALRAGATTPDCLGEAVERAGGLRFVTRARAALTHLEARSESLMESRLRVGFVLAGGPRMAAQVDIYDDKGVHCGRGDLYLLGVLIEYDGRAQRLTREAFWRDRRRQNRICDLQVEVRRFTSADYYGTSPGVRLDVLRKALVVAAARTRPRLRFGRDTLRTPQLRPLVTLAGRPAAA